MRSFQKWGWGQGAAEGENKSLGKGRSGGVGTLLLVLNFKKYACMCVLGGGVLEHVCTRESVRATSWELDLSNHHVISEEYTQVSSVEDTAV